MKSVQPAATKSDDSSEEQEHKEDEEMDEQAIEQELKRRQIKRQEADLMYQYHAKLRDLTMENFYDKPDEVNSIRLLNSSQTSVEIEWDEPCSNNSNITGYTVYLNEEVLVEGLNELFHVFESLQPKTLYRI